MSEQKEKWNDPKRIFKEYKKGTEYKSALGRLGMYEQNRINQRFYAGDQWHGVQCGEQKPLVRYNIIKRIGDYKMAMAAGNELSVRFSAEGIPCTKEMAEQVRLRKETYRQAAFDPSVDPDSEKIPNEEQINLVMDAMSDYFAVTAERVKFDESKRRAMRQAYITGSGVLYTYWDESIRTGQYADAGKTSSIKGDIRCEVLDIENVYLGDTAESTIQKQPYIIIAQRCRVDDLKREARRYRRPAEEIEKIQPDKEVDYMAGDLSEHEPTGERKATVLTKFSKCYQKDTDEYTIHAVRVVKGAVIRPEWDIGIRRYPLAKMDWEQMPNCAYGMSEVTNLVPNQIAINRAQTAAAHAVMIAGMPIMLVNTDVVTEPVTNDPGQVVPVAGSDDLRNAIHYEAPANFAPQFDNLVNSMVSNTMSSAGANDAALGDMRPDNASAYIAVRETATVPLELLKSSFYAFIEDVARIWAEYWVCMYGARKLKMEDQNGVWYIPFNGADYKDLLINVKVDVGPANLWSEIQTIQTLDKLLEGGIITPEWYIDHLPKGSIPDQSGLLRKLQEQNQPQPQTEEPPTEQQGAGGGIADTMGQLPAEYKQKIAGMTPEQQNALAQRLGGMNG